MIICKFCGQESDSNLDVCSKCAAKRQRPAVGFSLSGLLKSAKTAVQTAAQTVMSQQQNPQSQPVQQNPIPAQQQNTQNSPVQQIPIPAQQQNTQNSPIQQIPMPAQQQTVPNTPIQQIPRPPQAQLRPRMAEAAPTPIQNIPNHNFNKYVQSQNQPSSQTANSNTPNEASNNRQRMPTAFNSVSNGVNPNSQQKKTILSTASNSTHSMDVRTQSVKESGTEQKEIEEKVFNSEVTGYGDEELEIAILAGIMKDSFILESLKGKGLMAGLFSTRFTRGIYQSILSLREESPELSALDKIVLRNKMKQLNLLDNTVITLIEKIIAEIPPSIDQAMHYLELMKDQALKRKLQEVSQNIKSYIDKPEDHQNYNIETFTNKIIHDVRNIQKARNTKRINLVKEEMHDIINDMEMREQNGEIDIIGYSFEPMHYLCQAISGFRKGFMYAIAGAPRRGKTTFTLELATRVATLNHIPVLFFTYEQTKKNLTYRLLAKESRLNPDTLQRKRIFSDVISDAKFSGGWKKMQEYMDYFYIVEATKEDTVDRIRSYAYNAMQDFNTEDIMIFVDYIQKMPLSRNYNDEKFKVEEISTELKALSIELNNPIMTISSLSKEGCLIDATESAERPTMYHCKGSGDLEYDLDCAMIQAKDWGDTKELKEQMQQRAEQLGKDATRVPKVDVVNLYLDKNRDAPEGIFSVIQYLFFIEDNKFVELGPKYEDDRYRFGKIEELIDKLIAQNYIVFFDKPKDSGYHKGRVSIQLKNF